MSHPDRPSRPRIAVTQMLTESVQRRMTELFNADLRSTSMPLDDTALTALMQGCDVLVPTITDQINAALIEAAPDRLKLIANFGVGVDHIDLHAARARGIMVTNTPGVLTEDTADIAMALILGVPRRLAEGVRMMRAGEWAGWSPVGMLGHRVNGKTLAIIGMGRIGRAVAERARGFGIKLLYHNRHRLPAEVENRLGATHVDDLDAMLAAADIVSINCPHTPETHQIINAARLAKMKPDAYLINTARGEIIDEDALITALETGEIAGAGLDVFVNEPHVNPRLLALPNTLLLPHLGSATFEGRDAMGDKVIANIRAWADGHRPPDLVLEGWL